MFVVVCLLTVVVVALQLVLVVIVGGCVRQLFFVFVVGDGW